MSSWFYHLSPETITLHWVEEVTNTSWRYEWISIWWRANHLDWM